MIANSQLRAAMGAAARAHALKNFDWSVIFQRYRLLWSELNERRRSDPDLFGDAGKTIPDRPDPFALFASYPTIALAPETVVRLAPNGSMKRAMSYLQMGINRFAATSLPTGMELERMFELLAEGEMTVANVVAATSLDDASRSRVLRGLAWLCKMDLLLLMSTPETTR
jgi:hypothetical protein